MYIQQSFHVWTINAWTMYATIHTVPLLKSIRNPLHVQESNCFCVSTHSTYLQCLFVSKVYILVVQGSVFNLSCTVTWHEIWIYRMQLLPSPSVLCAWVDMTVLTLSFDLVFLQQFSSIISTCPKHLYSLLSSISQLLEHQLFFAPYSSLSTYMKLPIYSSDTSSLTFNLLAFFWSCISHCGSRYIYSY